MNSITAAIHPDDMPAVIEVVARLARERAERAHAADLAGLPITDPDDDR